MVTKTGTAGADNLLGTDDKDTLQGLGSVFKPVRHRPSHLKRSKHFAAYTCNRRRLGGSSPPVAEPGGADRCPPAPPFTP